MTKKVITLCPLHGQFAQTVQQYRRGQGCPTCGRVRTIQATRSSWEQFTKTASIKHKSIYTYPQQNYVNNKTKVKIICVRHGDFWQRPHNHLLGQGCPKCKTERIRQIHWKGYGELSKDHWSSIVQGAKKRDINLNITIEDAWKLFLAQNKKCALSNLPLEMHIPSSTGETRKHASWTASLDRIDSTKGYEIGNVQWVHKDIQQLKWNFSEQHFISLCKAVVQNQQQEMHTECPSAKEWQMVTHHRR